MKKHNTDLIGGLIMVAVALFFWTQMGKFTPYGKLFPRAIIICLLMAGAGLIVKAKINPSFAKLFSEDDKTKMILVAVISLVWVLFLKKIGFIVFSIVNLALLMWILTEKKNLKTLILSLLIASGQVGILYYIFAKVLYVPLPKGILF